jgi:uncharacterized protein YuzE
VTKIPIWKGASRLKVNYDPKEDILYFMVKEGPIVDSKEIGEDIRLEYDKSGEVTGLEIMNARKNIARTLAQEIAREIKAPADWQPAFQST